MVPLLVFLCSCLLYSGLKLLFELYTKGIPLFSNSAVWVHVAIKFDMYFIYVTSRKPATCTEISNCRLHPGKVTGRNSNSQFISRFPLMLYLQKHDMLENKWQHECRMDGMRDLQVWSLSSESSGQSGSPSQSQASVMQVRRSWQWNSPMSHEMASRWHEKG